MKSSGCGTPRTEQNTVCFTGHRHIDRERIPEIRRRLKAAISRCYEQGCRWFICGGALGFDTLAAEETIRFRNNHPDVVLSLAVPCADQAERWTEADRKSWLRIVSLADEKTVLSPVYYQGVMLARNRFMADRSSLCICYLEHWQGGAASAVRYALTNEDMAIINLALHADPEKQLLRENQWNYTYISPSAGRSAVTVRLRPSRVRKRTSGNMPTS